MLRTLALLAGLTAATAAQGEPANNFNALTEGLNACLGSLRLAQGTDVTIQFSLNRKGGLIGKPRLTHVVWGKDADPKRDAAAIAESFNGCLPAAITDAFGAAIAGRPFTYRLRAAPPEAKT